MAAVEAVDARHEAMLSLHRAILAIEAGCVHQAETHAMSAVAWMRNITTAQGLQDDDVRQSAGLAVCETAGWEYRP